MRGRRERVVGFKMWWGKGKTKWGKDTATTARRYSNTVKLNLLS